MGAGVADPKRISKDVIFPNYKWPELANIQQQWNVTTFVVLSQEMLKTINVGKSEDRNLYTYLCYLLCVNSFAIY